jgi:hypothetical protein
MKVQKGHGGQTRCQAEERYPKPEDFIFDLFALESRTIIEGVV